MKHLTKDDLNYMNEVDFIDFIPNKKIDVKSNELEYERIKIKFNKSLLTHLNNLKNDKDDY